MVKEAEVHAAEDKRRREVIDARNQADQLVYSIEKLISDNRDKIPAEEISRAEQEIANTKKAIEGDDLEAIKSAVDSLAKASHRISEILYRQTGAQQQEQQAQGQPGADNQAYQQSGDSSSGGNGKGEDEVIDAEVVDDDKKN
jgi:molecular chaperone DnaK